MASETFDAVGVSTYTDKRSGEEKTRFTRIGAAWRTKDGEGFSVTLDALPVSGRLIIRPKKDRDPSSSNEPVPF